MQELENNVLLRPATIEDEPFLFQLYEDGRTSELKSMGWNEQQIASFCEFQYRALSWSHRARYAAAEDQIVTLAQMPIGRLKVLETDTELLLVDIALLSRYQNHGIGSSLLNNLKERAQTSLKPLCLHVLMTNPVIRLYERLGFSTVRTNGGYIEMEYQPNSSSTPIQN